MSPISKKVRKMNDVVDIFLLVSFSVPFWEFYKCADVILQNSLRYIYKSAAAKPRAKGFKLSILLPCFKCCRHVFFNLPKWQYCTVLNCTVPSFSHYPCLGDSLPNFPPCALVLRKTRPDTRHKMRLVRV